MSDAEAQGLSWARIREVVSVEQPNVVVTVVRGQGIGKKMMVLPDRVEGSLGDAPLDELAEAIARERQADGRSGVDHVEPFDIDLFFDVNLPPPHLVIFGAVHAAQALVQIAAPMGYEITVVDARAQLATRERFPTVDRLVVAWPDEAYPELSITDTTCVVVLTHDPKFDEPAILGALATPALYIGAVGSRRTSQERAERLREAGVTDAQLSRVHGPIGLDIGGKTPEEMAISIMAEIIAVRNGRTGAALRDASGSIRGGA